MTPNSQHFFEPTSNAKNYKIERVGEELIIRVDAPASKGKANKRLLKILSDYFNVPKSNISIKKGLKSRNKVVEIL